ncbi:MAG: CdaR family protein [Candidatus Auribacterota bacterium]
MGKHWFLKNTLLKLIAIILATVTWFYLNDLVSKTETFTIPVDIKLPENLIQLNRSANTITLTLKGPAGVIDTITEESIRCFKELGPETQPGNHIIPVQDISISIPSSVMIENIFPPRLNLKIDRIIEKDFTVIVVTRGKPAPGFVELDTHRVNPSVIKLRGPEQMISSIDTVNTEPITINGLIGTKRFTDVSLQEFLPHKPLNEDKHVEVTIRIAEETATRTFSNIPIRMLEMVKIPYDVIISVYEAEVIVRGKPELLNKLNGTDVKLFFDITNLEPGVYDLPLSGILPDKFTREGVRITTITPSNLEVTIEVKKKESF